ncbi:MAG: stage 0 sporulation family protein [Clostridia bacterium]|nr:stage 0 sporulation family protein [Clostridia bacterium]
MATVVCVRFKNTGKVYYFSPAKVWPRPGELVIVETVRGLEIGETVTDAREISDESVVGELKPVIRKATPEDIKTDERNREKEKAAFPLCVQKINEHKLDMKLVNVECTFDGSKMVFYFTSEGRVDFRELVKDLAGVFHTRIELRQIGVRDEARFLGGLGICGRKICCGAFLNDFAPVSIKMAKEQNLSLNPTKISGQCGRLMCCLKYEQDNYEEILKKLPKIGKEIMTPDGIGVVTEIAVIREKVKVRMRVGEDFEVREYALEDVRRLAQGEKGEAYVPEKKPAPEATAPEPEETKPRYPRVKKQKTMNTDEYMRVNATNPEEAEEQTDI